MVASLSSCTHFNYSVWYWQCNGILDSSEVIYFRLLFQTNSIDCSICFIPMLRARIQSTSELFTLSIKLFRFHDLFEILRISDIEAEISIFDVDAAFYFGAHRLCRLLMACFSFRLSHKMLSVSYCIFHGAGCFAPLSSIQLFILLISALGGDSAKLLYYYLSCLRGTSFHVSGFKWNGRVYFILYGRIGISSAFLVSEQYEHSSQISAAMLIFFIYIIVALSVRSRLVP